MDLLWIIPVAFGVWAFWDRRRIKQKAKQQADKAKQRADCVQPRHAIDPETGDCVIVMVHTKSTCSQKGKLG